MKKYLRNKEKKNLKNFKQGACPEEIKKNK